MDIRQLARPARSHPPVHVPGHVDLWFDLWLESEWWQPKPNDDPSNNFFIMQVTLSTGQRYALNVWTFAFLATARQQAHTAGELLGGRYLLPPDVFVERLDRKLMEQVVVDLIQTNTLRHEWLCPPDNAAPA